jgi:nucleoside phosphorylase
MIHTAVPPQRHEVDVLIITAIPEEYEAARAVAGPSPWTDDRADGDAPFATTRFRSLSVALARPVRMGGRSTGPIATTLTDRLRPRCLAMCGVCAGNPHATAPGDVVVAAPAYEWDEGKHVDGTFRSDHHSFPLDSRWVRAVQEFDPSGLPSHGVAAEEEAQLWYLERLFRGQDPRRHPARTHYFPPATWGPRLERLESEGLIEWRDGQSALTGAGRRHIERVLYDDVDGPDRLPFSVRAGAMASGSAVVADARIWGALETRKRDLLALDMEAATIATVADDRKVPHWLVAKGVMDHADSGKDDRFKAFAARASAEVLFALLGRLLNPPPEPGPPAVPVPPGVRGAVLRRLTYYWQDLADSLGVPSHETRRFRAGDEPHDLWAWLDQRGRLADLPRSLDEIGRPDLAGLLRAYL